MSDTHIHIDAHELLAGWDSGKYKAGYVIDLLRKIDGPGSFPQRVQRNLNENGTQQPNESSDSKKQFKPYDKEALIKNADEILEETVAGQITCDKIAEIYTDQGWDGTDPYKKIKKLEPANVIDFLEDRKIRGEYYEQLSEPAQYLLRVLIPNAWRAWIRKHG